MLTREQNELLCRVEGGATMGQIMRRHWLPLCMAEEAAARDGAPVRARPLGEMREFEPPAWAPTRETRISIVKMHAACNWAQVLEGSIDSAHSSSLHSTNMFSAEVDGARATDSIWLRPSVDKAPRLQFEPTSYGFRYAAIRKPIRNPETDQYIRTTLFIAPFTVLIPPNDRYNLAQMLLPIDDVNSMFTWVAWHPDPEKGISQEEWRGFCAATIGVDLDENYRKKRNLENR